AGTVGLSAVLVSSALAFTAVKYLGAAYLIVLGIHALTQRVPPATTTVTIARSGLRRVFAQGVVVNILNPHTALFFFAFLPQFVDPSRGGVPAQMLALGVLFVLLSATTDTGWAIAAGTAGHWIRRNPQFARRQRYVTGRPLIGRGAATALTGSRHT